MWLTLGRESLRSLAANPLRTALAMLGMIIGVGSVILMLAIGQGAQLRMAEAIASMGSNILIVFPGSLTQSGVRTGAGAAPTLTLADADALSRLPQLDGVAPVHHGSVQVISTFGNWSTTIYGSTPEFADVRGWTVKEGEMIAESDVRSASLRAVIGKTVADNLFPNADPIGQTLRIRGLPLSVIGLLDEKGQNMDGRDQDDLIIVAISTAQRKLFGNPFPGTVRHIVVRAHDDVSLSSVQNEMRRLLRQRHRIPEGQDDDFRVRDLTAMAQSAAEQTEIMGFLLGAIASISLIVGGIGIMNIMLVSVTERTREIGIRMAIGARRKHVLLQFVTEAATICVLGGGLGLMLGIASAWGLSHWMELPVLVTLTHGLMALGVSATVALIFGFYPAWKASRLQPAEALRAL